MPFEDHLNDAKRRAASEQARNMAEAERLERQRKIDDAEWTRKRQLRNAELQAQLEADPRYREVVAALHDSELHDYLRFVKTQSRFKAQNKDNHIAINPPRIGAYKSDTVEQALSKGGELEMAFRGKTRVVDDRNSRTVHHRNRYDSYENPVYELDADYTVTLRVYWGSGEDSGEGVRVTDSGAEAVRLFLEEEADKFQKYSQQNPEWLFSCLKIRKDVAKIDKNSKRVGWVPVPEKECDGGGGY